MGSLLLRVSHFSFSESLPLYIYFSMVVNHLDRPNNYLINRLGLGATWRVPLKAPFDSKLYHGIFYIFLHKFTQSLMWVGMIFKRHLFAHFIFNYKGTTLLPRIKQAHISKFFRTVRAKVGMYRTSKAVFSIRKYLKYLLLSDLYFYKYSQWTLILMYCHIPEPVKRIPLFKREVWLAKQELLTMRENLRLQRKVIKFQINTRYIANIFILRVRNVFPWGLFHFSLFFLKNIITCPVG